ncbi:MAG: TMEM175 family protein [Microthrixaceae bacterium]
MYDLGRFRGFSDCVFAVALTVLAVVATVPPSGSGATAMDSFLRDEAVRYAPFLGSFLAVGYLWLQHHRLYSVVRRVDRPAVLSNLVLLCLVVLIPWLAQLGSAYNELRTPHLLFATGQVAAGGVLLAVGLHLRRAGLLVPGLSDRAAQVLLWRIAVLPIAWSGAFILTLLGAGWIAAGWPLVILGSLAVHRWVGPLDEAVGVDGTSAEDLEVEPPRSARQLPSVVRIEGFSDNVFAFGVTALVFQLQVPDRVATSEADLLRYLGQQFDPNLTGYVLGFVVMGLLWVLHVSHLALVERHGRRLATWNLVHLMTIAVLPFTTLLYSDVRTGTTTGLFAASAALAGLTSALLWRHVVHHRLQVPWLTAPRIRATSARAAAVPAVLAISLPVAWGAPALAPLVWAAGAVIAAVRWPIEDATADEWERAGRPD